MLTVPKDTQPLRGNSMLPGTMSILPQRQGLIIKTVFIVLLKDDFRFGGVEREHSLQFLALLLFMCLCCDCH